MPTAQLHHVPRPLTPHPIHKPGAHQPGDLCQLFLQHASTETAVANTEIRTALPLKHSWKSEIFHNRKWLVQVALAACSSHTEQSRAHRGSRGAPSVDARRQVASITASNDLTCRYACLGFHHTSHCFAAPCVAAPCFAAPCFWRHGSTRRQSQPHDTARQPHGTPPHACTNTTQPLQSATSHNIKLHTRAAHLPRRYLHRTHTHARAHQPRAPSHTLQHGEVAPAQRGPAATTAAAIGSRCVHILRVVEREPTRVHTPACMRSMRARAPSGVGGPASLPTLQPPQHRDAHNVLLYTAWGGHAGGRRAAHTAVTHAAGARSANGQS